jgi:uncharacterized OB-fold protein
METLKSTPPIDPWTRPFWQAARQGKLMIQQCQSCRRHIFYPRIICPFCFSEQITWVESTGKGKIYTFSVVQNNAPSAFIPDMPFIIAIVRLDEGVQMMTNIVGCDPSQVHCDMPVTVVFEKFNDEITLPKFKPLLS